LLFEPFYTTKEPGEGTGLGLYMSRCMVESAGGSLECASRPGVGTMMRVKLGYEDKDHDPDR